MVRGQWGRLGEWGARVYERSVRGWGDFVVMGAGWQVWGLEGVDWGIREGIVDQGGRARAVFGGIPAVLGVGGQCGGRMWGI